MQNPYSEIAVDSETVNTEEQLNIRIAWYYYVINMTQQQIADRFGITRVRVNKALATCRETGVVQIRINSPLTSCVELELRLQERYGLERVTVVPTPEDPGMIFRVLSVGLAPTLEAQLFDGCVVAVGWGRTLRQAVRELQGRPLPQMTVLSLLGGLHYGSANNTVEVASSLAGLFGGTYYYLAAPVFAPSQLYRDMILAEASVQNVLGKARNADLALLTVGDLSERSLMAGDLGGAGRLAAHQEGGAGLRRPAQSRDYSRRVAAQSGPRAGDRRKRRPAVAGRGKVID